MATTLDPAVAPFVRIAHHSNPDLLRYEALPQALDRAIAWAVKEVARLSEQASALALDAEMHAAAARRAICYDAAVAVAQGRLASDALDMADLVAGRRS